MRLLFASANVVTLTKSMYDKNRMNKVDLLIMKEVSPENELLMSPLSQLNRML